MDTSRPLPTPAEDLALARLLDLARDRSAEARGQLVAIIGDLFFDNTKVLSDRERALMTDILRQLIHDVEVTVRRALAERLASEDGVPPDLVSALANDVIEVAYPMLRHSEALQDIELIEIVRHRTQQHQLAVALRRRLSEAVSDALVETRNEDVIRTLLENQDARISQGAMEYLVGESKRLDVYQNPLIKREELTPELARRMYWWVSAALRAHIAERFSVDAAGLDEAIQETVKEVLDETRFRKPAPVSPRELARHLAKRQGITPRLLIQALRQGEVPLFEELFGELTRLPARLVRRFMFETGGEGLSITCRAVGIDKADFASIFILSRGARPGEKEVDPDELSRVMNFYDAVDRSTAEKVVRRWRLDPDYLYALRVVESGDE